MATKFDYTSLLPGELESTLKTLAEVYQDNSNQLNNAYLHTVLPGVHTSARMFCQTYCCRSLMPSFLSQHCACEGHPISSRVSLVSIY